MDPVEIDGGRGEGGGSVLRLGAALATVFQRPVRVYNVRAKRNTPGLRPQHLVGLQALATVSRGRLEGGEIGSTDITFRPGRVEPGCIEVSIGTAGSIGMIYQALSIACASLAGAHPVEVSISGGATYGKWAPAVVYVQEVIAPLLARMGFETSIEIHRHGFYPKGGASATMRFHPVHALHGLVLDERGEITAIEGESIASQHLERPRVAKRQASAFVSEMAPVNAPRVDIAVSRVQAANPGSGITAWARTTTGCIIGSGSVAGERGLSSERVGQACARSLLDTLTRSPLATVDAHASDQLLPFMLLSKGRSRFIAPPLTGHAKTNLDVARRFTNRPCQVSSNGEHAIFDFPPVD